MLKRRVCLGGRKETSLCNSSKCLSEAGPRVGKGSIHKPIAVEGGWATLMLNQVLPWMEMAQPI
jgi:hypothetical protein